MQRISPFLWFDNQAEEAANFYISIFKSSRIISLTRYTDTGPGPKGSVMTVHFQLHGQEFIALNGGPEFKFTEAISFSVDCKDQQEIDYYWAKLAQGGEQGPCGWLKDKFGLSWQIVPNAFIKMLHDPDPQKVDRAMKSMMTMKKLEIEKLRQAFQGP